MTTLLRSRTLWIYALGIAVALLLPQVFTTRYALSVLVLTGMFIIFALSYDLSVGHVGTVHLAAPAFFGLGAYVTGLIGVPLGLPFVANMLLSAVAMAAFAQVVGIPSFRLSNVTFAIGTLAFATASQQVVNSAVELTRGPLCVQRIPRPEIVIPGLLDLKITSTNDYYYLLIPLVFLTILVYRALTESRIGRAFAAVRDDEVLAAAAGVHPLRYKMLAFTVGAAIAGALGSFQAHYLTLICPNELAADYTIRLLIIIFVGGAGSLTGLLLGAIVFTVLPELMRGLGNIQITPAHQLILFGFILLLVIKYAPGGLQEIWTRGTNVRLRRRPPADDDEPGDAP
jgi:ABC-type branched-subunit amino acid transport system permease subunit